MEKDTKIAVIVGLIIVAGGVGTWLYVSSRKKKKENETNGYNNDVKVGNEPIVSPPNQSTSPSAGKPNNSTSTSTSNVPFKNKKEGDRFRNWVNDKYPDYARSINLDRTGSYNNMYIEKAWKDYGAVYFTSFGWLN